MNKQSSYRWFLTPKRSLDVGALTEFHLDSSRNGLMFGHENVVPLVSKIEWLLRTNSYFNNFNSYPHKSRAFRRQRSKSSFALTILWIVLTIRTSCCIYKFDYKQNSVTGDGLTMVPEYLSLLKLICYDAGLVLKSMMYLFLQFYRQNTFLRLGHNCDFAQSIIDNHSAVLLILFTFSSGSRWRQCLINN